MLLIFQNIGPAVTPPDSYQDLDNFSKRPPPQPNSGGVKPDVKLAVLLALVLAAVIAAIAVMAYYLTYGEYNFQ